MLNYNVESSKEDNVLQSDTARCSKTRLPSVNADRTEKLGPRNHRRRTLNGLVNRLVADIQCPCFRDMRRRTGLAAVHVTQREIDEFHQRLIKVSPLKRMSS